MPKTILTADDKDLLFSGTEFWKRDDRHEMYKKFRNEAPVSFHPEVEAPWSPEGGPGFWAVTRYEDVVKVTRDHLVYSNKQGTQPEYWPEFRVAALGMLHMDAPEHRTWRTIVGPAFAPRFLDGMLETIRGYATEVIDRLVAEPEVDVLANLVNTYPVKVIAGMMGFPDEDHEKFVDWTYLAFGKEGAEKAAIAHKELIEYGTAKAAEHRANPSDDVMDRLISGEVNGQRLTDLEIGQFVSLLVGAGAETTGSSLATGLWQLASNPDQWEALKNDRSLIKGAVDEFFRFTSAVVQWRRTTTEDVELNGQLIKAGEKVVMNYESANFDETVFENPEKFDITRDARKQVALGAGGPHQCLGEHLARREIQVFLEELLDRVERIEVVAELTRPPLPRFNMVSEFRAAFVTK